MERERRIPAGFGLLIVALLAILIGGILLLDVDYDILPFLDTSALASARILLLVITVVAVVWVAMWVLGRLFQRVAIARVRSYGQVRSIWKLASYAVWAVVLLVLVLGLLGDVTSTALSVGLIGAALAFVLQKPLLDIAGWIIITYHRMYRIGDRVSLGGTRGYVVDVRLLHTELMETGEWMQGDTFTGRQVLIPNSVIFEGPTHNYTRDTPFVWDEVVNLVTYESDIEVAKTHMLEAAQEVVGEAMRSNYQRYLKNLPIRDLESLLIQEPKIRMKLRDSGVDLYVLYWVPAELRRKVESEITDRVWKRFMEDPRVEIAYPHMELVRHPFSWGDEQREPPSMER